MYLQDRDQNAALPGQPHKNALPYIFELAAASGQRCCGTVCRDGHPSRGKGRKALRSTEIDAKSTVTTASVRLGEDRKKREVSNEEGSPTLRQGERLDMEPEAGRAVH